MEEGKMKGKTYEKYLDLRRKLKNNKKQCNEDFFKFFYFTFNDSQLWKSDEQVSLTRSFCVGSIFVLLDPFCLVIKPFSCRKNTLF